MLKATKKIWALSSEVSFVGVGGGGGVVIPVGGVDGGGVTVVGSSLCCYISAN